MVSIDILLRGVPGLTDEGSLGQSTVTLLGETTIVDTGGPARRPLLTQTLDDAGVDPASIKHVLLTHLHFDHCENLHLFPNATVHVYGPELKRVRDGRFDWATTRTFDAIATNHKVEEFYDGEEVVDNVTAVHTPGHVEQHVSFVVDDTYGIVGDAVKNIQEFVTGQPVTMFDDDVACETYDRLADRLDFVVPGHDIPFHLDEDGDVVPCGNVDLSIALKTGTDAGSRIRLASTRTKTRPLPEGVTIQSTHLSLD